MSLYAALDSSRYINEHWRDNAESLYETVAFRNVIGADRRLQTSGVAFARKHHLTVLHAKNNARRRILNSLSRDEWSKQLRVLTMPGLEWTFEKLLIAERDYSIRGDGWLIPSGGAFVGIDQKTLIHSVEYDPAIYFASLKWIPARRRGLTQLSAHAVSTRTVDLYYFTDVETFIGDRNCPEVDAAWLDFTGYMTPARLHRINRFWKEKCKWQLALTVLNARYPSHVRACIQKHGSMETWITNTLAGQVYDVHHYFDDHSAMLQIIVRK
jgi:hypothetical protein